MATRVPYSVVNPEAQRSPAAEGAPTAAPSTFLAPRLDTLNGKTVYLVDQGFGGSTEFLEQFRAWFAEHMPTVKTIQKRKPGFIFRDDSSQLWEEIREQKGNAVIMGVAG